MDTPLSELKLKVLYEIGQIIGQALNLDQTLEKVLKILGVYLSMKKATITLKDAKTGHLRLRICHGLTDEEKSRGIYYLPHRFIIWIESNESFFRRGEPCVRPGNAKGLLLPSKDFPNCFIIATGNSNVNSPGRICSPDRPRRERSRKIHYLSEFWENKKV